MSVSGFCFFIRFVLLVFSFGFNVVRDASLFKIHQIKFIFTLPPIRSVQVAYKECL
jgi:hypothetical protein